ncbi:hypothetical protein BDY21DRAFT_370351 [Lineolata rhizophorae]|uniref:C2H2-type domain-containing protein n=1 Tax=Lineolata rhizophorae TaxID=578093 RepID=A0A6A6P6P2_9PEZI|nr:hypothetical protein BDY21DRAFT_370351 [Lineolata rhizophorae]
MSDHQRASEASKRILCSQEPTSATMRDPEGTSKPTDSDAIHHDIGLQGGEYDLAEHVRTCPLGAYCGVAFDGSSHTAAAASEMAPISLSNTGGHVGSSSAEFSVPSIKEEDDDNEPLWAANIPADVLKALASIDEPGDIPKTKKKPSGSDNKAVSTAINPDKNTPDPNLKSVLLANATSLGSEKPTEGRVHKKPGTTTYTYTSADNSPTGTRKLAVRRKMDSDMKDDPDEEDPPKSPVVKTEDFTSQTYHALVMESLIDHLSGIQSGTDDKDFGKEVKQDFELEEPEPYPRPAPAQSNAESTKKAGQSKTSGRKRKGGKSDHLLKDIQRKKDAQCKDDGTLLREQQALFGPGRAQATQNIGLACWKLGCSAKFQDENEIMAHAYEVHGQGYPCPAAGCGFLARHIKDIDKHMERVHPGTSLYRCHFCECLEQLYSKRRDHITSEHRWVKNACRAPTCRKGFPDEAEYRAHVEREHPEEASVRLQARRI